MSDQLDRYFRVLEDHGGYRRAGNLRFMLDELFDGVDLTSRTVLDVGAGSGYVSLFAACAGASKVIALEPEAAGSSTGMAAEAGRLAQQLGCEDRFRLRTVTFQEFDPGADRFDVLCLNASVNHLDEDACIRLHLDEGARERYRTIFSHLASMAAPGARLIVSDCSRHNLFAHLRLTNPIAPTIEWHKHQSPRRWSKLLEEQGFRNARVSWTSFNSLRTPGRLVLGNRVASYLLTSSFCLTMDWPGGEQDTPDLR